jgi:site-specific DNA recombinase
MSMISATHLGCSAARNKGTCANRRTIAGTDLEGRVLSALAIRLMDPELFAVFCKEFTAETNRLRAGAHNHRLAQEQELAMIRRDLDRLVQAILDGTPGRVLSDKITKLETRRDQLEAALAEREAPPPVLHPAMAEVYHRKVADLAEALNRDDTRAEAAEILRGLVERIELQPSDAGYDILLRGDLAGILALSAQSKKPAALSRGGLLQVTLVAGVGFEPTTFRL